jgi:TRAP-type mannitol/chloroaromatic compound transport system substrate-binding protein
MEFPMKLKALLAAAILTVGATLQAQANEFSELRTKVSAARESLVTMLTNKDKRGPDQQKIVKDTADAVSAQLDKMKAPAGKEAAFKELVDNWNAFKKTREQELVPAILAGKEDEAKKLATGIQKERVTKCQAALTQLGG